MVKADSSPSSIRSTISAQPPPTASTPRASSSRSPGPQQTALLDTSLFVQEIDPSALADLTIAMKPVITWPGSLSNYELQSRDSLTSTNWTVVTNAPVLVNGQNAVILDPTAVQSFYRLQRIQ